MSRKVKSGLESLKHVSEADNVYEAAAIWWGRQLLNPHFDLNYGPESRRQKEFRIDREAALLATAMRRRDHVKKNVCSFVVRLTELAQSADDMKINVRGLEPDQILADAAEDSGIIIESRAPLFPAESHTLIVVNKFGEGVLAKSGASAEEQWVWRRPE